MCPIDLKKYYPRIYDGFAETEAVIETENLLFCQLNDEVEKAFRNQFVVTADESGIREYERMLNIIPNTAIEDLEFRRERIINRISTRLPLTLPLLRQRLGAVTGIEWISAEVDYDNLILHVVTGGSSQSWFEEIFSIVNSFKPANIEWRHKGIIKSENNTYSASALTESYSRTKVLVTELYADSLVEISVENYLAISVTGSYSRIKA